MSKEQNKFGHLIDEATKTPRTDEHLRWRRENGYVAIITQDFARQLETELAEARAEIEKFKNLFKNGIDCFMSPCEKHSGDNTPPFTEFMEKYGHKCTPCLVEELAAAKAKLRDIGGKNEKKENEKLPVVG
jgi:hypothetical protein